MERRGILAVMNSFYERIYSALVGKNDRSGEELDAVRRHAQRLHESITGTVEKSSCSPEERNTYVLKILRRI